MLGPTGPCANRVPQSMQLVFTLQATRSRDVLSYLPAGPLLNRLRGPNAHLGPNASRTPLLGVVANPGPLQTAPARLAPSPSSLSSPLPGRRPLPRAATPLLLPIRRPFCILHRRGLGPFSQEPIGATRPLIRTMSLLLVGSALLPSQCPAPRASRRPQHLTRPHSDPSGLLLSGPPLGV
ncbi:hypothetical protein NDU88_000901 [Pleurodeles waltl]|uniref:Uncharacterized protein n=1 Tax=Pleurodeles waltl TaxID=8319 RepID=A0AAV7URA0_PLEWA|nr:hypothetical protein NDU88_000901 [Pleurodeles waltl]